MAKAKIDLILLKRLVAELEASVATVDTINTDVNTDNTELVVEASKAAGLAAGVMQEACGLISDIYKVVQGTQAQPNKNEFLKNLLGSLKGPGGSN